MDFSQFSPDVEHPGWRLKAAGPEAQRRQAILFRSCPQQRELTMFSNIGFFRRMGPGAMPLVQVHEGRTGPRFVVLLLIHP